MSRVVILPTLDKRKLRGKDHHRWKGGIKINSQGYRLIYASNHPFRDQQGYVREHRLVIERFLDRYLTKQEVVHHINGNKIDNRLVNLRIMKKIDHDKLRFGENNSFYGKHHSKENLELLSKIGKHLAKFRARDERGRFL